MKRQRKGVEAGALRAKQHCQHCLARKLPRGLPTEIIRYCSVRCLYQIKCQSIQWTLIKLRCADAALHCIWNAHISTLKISSSILQTSNLERVKSQDRLSYIACHSKLKPHLLGSFFLTSYTLQHPDCGGIDNRSWC